MKDLDFDELDRAVNSLMTDAAKSDDSKPEETEKTLDITPTLSADTPPSFEKLEEATAEVTKTPTPSVEAPKPAAPAAKPVPAPAAPASRPPLAARRGGRFMDVVHPSSDMKKTTTPTHSVSRQGTTIAPAVAASQPPKPAVEAPADVLETPVEKTPEVPQKPVEQPHEPAAPVSEWPDPLEMADFKTDTPTPEKEETASDEPFVVLQPEKEDATKPLTSPFLPDTKVEKRPLGSSAPTPAEEPDRAPSPDAKLEPMTVSDPNAQLPADPVEAVTTELPEEFQDDLVAVEADTSHQEALNAQAAEKTSAMPMPTAAPQEDEKLLPAGPTSIPQQYREEPSTGDKDSGAIYDTDTYHQPLAHPAKKKSGWMWVLWIAIILVLGAGGGAALYFLGIV